MKCHLCGTYLTECAPIWNVGGRALHEYKCLDRKCASINYPIRCSVGMIIPDNDITSYTFLVSYNEQWYKVWAIRKSEADSTTTLYKTSVNDRGFGIEEEILTVPRYYELSYTDDFKAKSQEFLEKFKRLIPFL